MLSISTCESDQVWAMTFMQDPLAVGRRFRTVNMVDVYTGECRVTEVDTRLAGARVAGVLERLGEVHDAPEQIIIDNGPEFTSKVRDAWAYARKVALPSSNRVG